jgi:HPt (histidine-containing phosphotransfer) domain-containing protein
MCLQPIAQRDDEAVSALHTAFRIGDAERVQAYAHKLKGVSRTIGAIQVMIIGQLIEDAARRGNIQEAKENLDAFESAYEATCSEITRRIIPDS